MTMARAATIEALRKRGVSKKTAETLADAGFTLETLTHANVARLRKFISEREAVQVLKKLGTPMPEEKPGKLGAKAASGRKPRKAAAAAGPGPERLVVPSKTPPLTKGEREIYEIAGAQGKVLPPSLVADLATRIEGLKLSRKKVEEIVVTVAGRYERHRIDPNESAGIVSAQSIGEPGTQMSLPRDEKIVIRLAGRVRCVPIGDFVDSLMARFPVKRDGATELCDLPPHTEVEVPSLALDGRIAWKAVHSVSRHRHGSPMLRLTTRTGREITATANHSFVTRRDGRIVPIAGRDLRRGAHIPVVRHLPLPATSTEVELEEFLPKDAYWFGRELARARMLGPHWREGFGRDFVVPVRSDALGRYLRGVNEIPIEEGFVYPFGNHSRARIPERLPLDASFGWLVGAFLSEGWASRYFVNISNMEAAFLRRTRLAADRLGVRHAGFENSRGFARGYDLHLRSRVLSELLRTSCGSGSDSKRVPDFAFGASDTFAGALLRAYFDGDGNVTVARGAIRASSNSKELIDGISLLLARFGILASKGRTGRQHTLWVPRRQARTFRDSVGFEAPEKRRLLDELCDAAARRYTYDALDMVSGFGSLVRDVAVKLQLPTRHVNNFDRRQRIGRATLARYVAWFEKRARTIGVDVSDDLRRLREFLDEDVTWDTIVAIREVARPSEPVYDLSVPGLETFTTAEGIVTHNTMRTFHYAGVAEMNVTLGLPRLIEIVDARRVPSTPIMEIHLKGSPELDRIRKYATEIEMTVLQDIAEIEADPVNMRVLVFPDEHRMKSRGVGRAELDEKLSKLGVEVEVKRAAGAPAKAVRAFAIEAGESSYKKLQRLLEQVKTAKIKGIENLKRAIIKRRGDRYVIYTEGSNLDRVLELPFVDPAQTTTNSIQEIYDVLGVEAARNAIIAEAVATLSEQGLVVDIRHIMLVSDMMTNDGDVKAIGRHGISGRKSSVLARAAFEITAHHLLRAAITGEVDYLDGVAENVIVGQPVTLGTGAVNLVYQAGPKR